MLAARKLHKAFGRGTLTFLKPAQPQDPRLPARVRGRSPALRGQSGALGAAGRARSVAAQGADSDRSHGPRDLPVRSAMRLMCSRSPVTASCGSGSPRATKRRPSATIGRRAKSCRYWCCSTDGKVCSAIASCRGVIALSEKVRAQLERDLLPAFVAAQRWYAAKGEIAEARQR